MDWTPYEALALQEMDEPGMQKHERWNDGDGTNLNFWNGNEMK